MKKIFAQTTVLIRDDHFSKQAGMMKLYCFFFILQNVRKYDAIRKEELVIIFIT